MYKAYSEFVKNVLDADETMF